MKSSPRHSVVRFGTYQVSLGSGEVRKAGLRIRVQQQPMKLRSGFDPLRSDPRFEDLMRRIGLPE